MTVGTSTYMGLAVPLFGEAKIVQTTGATDILTIEGGDGQTGDFVVLRDSTETERFVVEDGGNVVITQGAAADIGLKILRYSAPSTDGFSIHSNDGSATKRFAITKNYQPALRIKTTKPTTGLVKGELMLIFHGSVPKLGVCYSTGSQGIRMIRLKTKTIGRLTA
jgi:hypothetical protein